MIRHPLQSVPAEKYRACFLSLLASTLAMMLIMNVVSIPLTTPTAPLGVISYELAGNLEKSRQILESWDAVAKLRAAFGLGFDYLFMVAYSLTIGLGCIWAGGVLRARRWPLAGIDLALAWGLVLAAVTDGLENIALTTMLFNAPATPWPEISFWCATLKFLLIFAGLVYAFYGAVVRMVVKP